MIYHNILHIYDLILHDADRVRARLEAPLYARGSAAGAAPGGDSAFGVACGCSPRSRLLLSPCVEPAGRLEPAPGRAAGGARAGAGRAAHSACPEAPRARRAGPRPP